MFCLFFAPGPVIDLAERETERSRKRLRSFFRHAVSTRRLFCAVAVRDRIPLDRAHDR